MPCDILSVRNRSWAHRIGIRQGHRLVGADFYELNHTWDKEDFMGLFNIQRPLRLEFIGKRYEGVLGQQEIAKIPQLFKPMRRQFYIQNMVEAREQAKV